MTATPPPQADTPTNNPKNLPPPYINLTDKPLTQGHLNLFKKGPSFVPTTFSANQSEFVKDLNKWENRMRYGIFYKLNPVHEKHSDNMESLNHNEFMSVERELVKSGDTRQAPTGKSHALELYIQNVEADIKNHKEITGMGYNLSKEERAALQDIKSWDDVVIRPYDKGKGFVLDTATSYKARMYKELNNLEVYEKLHMDEQQTALEINELLRSWAASSLERGDINGVEFVSLMKKNGIQFFEISPKRFRLVTHCGIDAAEIEETLSMFSRVMNGLS